MSICAATVHFSSIAYCEYRKTLPTVIEYPGAQLTRQYVDFLYDSYSITLWPIELEEPHLSLVVYYYETSDRPEEVQAFFAANGGSISPQKPNPNNPFTIEGIAQPFGEYDFTARWNQERSLTEYFIEIFWESCD